MKLSKILLLLATMAITLGFAGCQNFNLTDVLNGEEVLVPNFSLDSLFEDSTPAAMVSRVASVDPADYLYDLSQYVESGIPTSEYDFNMGLMIASPFTRSFEKKTINTTDTTVPVKANNGNHYAFGIDKNGNNGNHYHYGWANGDHNNHIEVTINESIYPIEITENVIFDVLNYDSQKDGTKDFLIVNRISTFKIINGSLDGDFFEIDFLTKIYFYNPEISNDPKVPLVISPSSVSGTITRTSTSYSVKGKKRDVFTLILVEDISTDATTLEEYIYELDPTNILDPTTHIDMTFKYDNATGEYTIIQ